MGQSPLARPCLQVVYLILGAYIVYVDETWAFENMYELQGWAIRGLIPERIVEEGSSPFYPVAAHHGSKRIIIIGALTENGLLPNSTFINTGGFTSDGDYHKTVNSEMFERWLENLLPQLAQDSDDREVVIVLDNASYHGRTLLSKEAGKKPKRKAEIQKWLSDNDIPFEPGDKVPFLKDLMEQAIEIFELDTTVVDTICDEASKAYGKKFSTLRTPPYHCMLNAIEMFWSQLKHYLRQNTRNKIQDIIRFTNDFCNNFTPLEAQKLFEHVIKEENKFRAIQDQEAIPIPIQIDQDFIRAEVETQLEMLEIDSEESANSDIEDTE